MTHRRWLVLCVCSALSLALVLPASALGAEGSYGPHYPQAICYTTTTGVHQLIVPAPQIYSSAVVHPPNVAVIGNQHLQLAAYQVNIFYSTDGINWVFTTPSSWRSGWVGDGINAVLPPSQWWDLDHEVWTNETFTWDLNPGFYYRAAIQFYWYADELSAYGYDYLWADHFDYSILDPGVQQWCAA